MSAHQQHGRQDGGAHSHLDVTSYAHQSRQDTSIGGSIPLLEIHRIDRFTHHDSSLREHSLESRTGNFLGHDLPPVPVTAGATGRRRIAGLSVLFFATLCGLQVDPEPVDATPSGWHRFSVTPPE